MPAHSIQNGNSIFRRNINFARCVDFSTDRVPKTVQAVGGQRKDFSTLELRIISRRYSRSPAAAASPRRVPPLTAGRRVKIWTIQILYIGLMEKLLVSDKNCCIFLCMNAKFRFTSSIPYLPNKWWTLNKLTTTGKHTKRGIKCEFLNIANSTVTNRPRGKILLKREN
uniref:Uncharacterized protein n=1 Tax=Romanomermis culicivorax TaxID=13658 RepID=A0A915KKT7_ROMCU